MPDSVRILLARIDERTEKTQKDIDEIKLSINSIKENNVNQWKEISSGKAGIKHLWWIIGIIFSAIGGLVFAILK